jgi:hypothetical protein
MSCRVHDRSSDPLERSTAVMSRRTALRLGAGTVGAAALSAYLGRGMVRAQTTPSPPGDAGEEPNHFVLEGAESRITYDMTTISGAPQLAYEGPYGTHSFDGDTLTTEETALGRLVTGYLGAFPDRGDLWLTLVLPTFDPMTLDDGPAPVDTLAILKWLVSTIAGPPVEGALEEYQVLMLTGTAEFVMP